MFLAILSVATAQVDAHGPISAVLDADPRDSLLFRRPGHREAGATFVGGIFGYNNRPLIARDVSSGEEVALIEDTFVLDLNAGWAPTPWAQLDVTVPLYGFRGNSVSVDFANPLQTGGIGVADARMAVLLNVLSPNVDEQGLGVGIVSHVDLPTGRLHPNFGRQALAGGVGVVASEGLEALTLSGRLGVQLDPSPNEGAPSGPVAQVGASVGYLLDDELGVGLEWTAGLPLHQRGAGVPIETIARIRYAEAGGLHALAGAAVGLSSGVGTATYRVFVGGGFGTTGAARDRDMDGLVDALDACPKKPETLNGLADEDGCPDRLPRLRLGATLDGVLLPGISLSLTGPMDRSWTTTSLPESLEVAPDTVWKATAAAGACLRGEAIAPVGEQDVELYVPMKRVEYANVEVYVLNKYGDPATGALLEFLSDDAFCVPSAFITVDAEGLARASVGPGTHEIRATLDEDTSTLTLTVEEGRLHEVDLVLR